MNTKLLFGVLLGGVILLGTGCTFPSQTAVLPRSQVGRLQTTETGTIVKVSEITIEGRRTHLGQAGGAIIGAAAANPSGRGRGAGNGLAVAGAAVVGAIAGDAVEEYATRKRAQEISVKLKNGSVVVIVQAAPPDYAVGDVVEVVHDPMNARVILAMGP